MPLRERYASQLMAGEQLRVTEGAERGKLLSVAADLLIGREAPDEPGKLGLDPELSRRHARVSRGSDGGLTIEDLGSANGTFVNGAPTREKTLEHGDRIKIGASQFIFLVRDDEVLTNVPLTDSFEDQFTTAVTVKLEQENSVYLQPEKIAQALPAGGRVARDLAALLKISTAISGIRKAIDNGLSTDDALRAVTINPARILGVERQLGTLERRAQICQLRAASQRAGATGLAGQ